MIDKNRAKIFADRANTLSIVLQNGKVLALERSEEGFFTAEFEELENGTLYYLQIDGKELYPDPMSRYQPQGPTGPSQIVDPTYPWRDKDWKGIKAKNEVLYEMHIGTFTQEGTYKAAEKELLELADLGITAIELMPLHDFPGNFGWGYDVINLFAPKHLYGSPEELRHFIEEAHLLGIGVILDVVYNHFGPFGNFLPKFSSRFFAKTQNEWGSNINFDEKEIREFFIDNALYWLQEYHFDGLRLDAVQAIHSKEFFLELKEKIKESEKPCFLICENERQQVEMLEQYGFNAVWNDDFHHSARVRLTGMKEAYYSDYTGSAQELISCFKYGYLYQGQYSSWQSKNRGTPSLNIPLHSFIIYLQNHDQVANSSCGKRIHQLSHLGDLKAMTALLLLSPCIPMLFQGQEFASENPFLYFSDYPSTIAREIYLGRKKFLSQFPHISEIPIPSELPSFYACKLDASRKKSPIYFLHKDLIYLRKNDLTFSQEYVLEGAVLQNDALLFRYLTKKGQDRLLICNFSNETKYVCAEPLLAPSSNCIWTVLWHSEDLKYGGEGFAPYEGREWVLPAHAAFILKEEACNS